MECLIVQPIHQAGSARLAQGGVTARLASSARPETVEREIGKAVAVITRNAGLSAAAMDAAPRLRVIGVHGTGTDPVDVEHATALGIPVVSSPTANSVSVAEQALALMLGVAKRLPAADRAVRRGNFSFKYGERLSELEGKTLGIIGWGRIGRRMAAISRGGLGMRIIVFSPSAAREEIEREGFEKCESLDGLLADADVVSLHLPLRPDTRHLLGEREFRLMRPGAILVNTGRGATVDEAALVSALSEGHLAGAGLDVFTTEEMPDSYRLLQLDNVVLSPHLGGSTEEALERTALAVAEEVLSVLRGERPRHLVNPTCWQRRVGGGEARGSAQ